MLKITSPTSVFYANTASRGVAPDCRDCADVLQACLGIRDPQGEHEPQAFLSTNSDPTPVQILTRFVRRWRMEVTFEEARAHLGIETQRHWDGYHFSTSSSNS